VDVADPRDLRSLGGALTSELVAPRGLETRGWSDFGARDSEPPVDIGSTWGRAVGSVPQQSARRPSTRHSSFGRMEQRLHSSSAYKQLHARGDRPRWSAATCAWRSPSPIEQSHRMLPSRGRSSVSVRVITRVTRHAYPAPQQSCSRIEPAGQRRGSAWSSSRCVARNVRGEQSCSRIGPAGQRRESAWVGRVGAPRGTARGEQSCSRIGPAGQCRESAWSVE
jgi:hypothetical protein